MSETVGMHGFSRPKGLTINFCAYASEAKRLAAKPGKNTIGIITEAPITGYVLSPTAPQTAEEGGIWIRTGLSSTAAYDALPGGNALIICPQEAKQYVSKAWKPVDAQSYIGGKWVAWNIAIVTDGKTDAAISTQGLLPEENTGYQGSLTVAKNTADITVSFAPSYVGNRSGGIAVFGKYDLTAFRKLVFEGSVNITETGEVGLSVWSSTEGITYTAQNRVKHRALTDSAELDISDLNGEFVVGFSYESAFEINHTITGLRMEA